MKPLSILSISGGVLFFKLKLKKVAGYWNYDSSEFDRVSPLLDDDDVRAIWKKRVFTHGSGYSDQFKSYDDLKKRMDYVLGTKKRQASSGRD